MKKMIASIIIIGMFILTSFSVFAIGVQKSNENQITYQKTGWYKLFADDGFGRGTNVATRGMVVYNNELYVGTENHNKSKLNLNCNGFIAGTRITMVDGSYKNIEDIRVGDVVKAYDIGNLKYVNANVIKVYNYNSDELPDHHIVFNSRLHTSPNQVLYVNGNLMKAENAKRGDYLVDITRAKGYITSINNHAAKASMYSFMINEVHLTFLHRGPR